MRIYSKLAIRSPSDQTILNSVNGDGGYVVQVKLLH